MANYTKVLEDTIFPSFIRSCVPDLDLNELKKDCYLIKQNEPSKQASNHGGYHSPAFKNDEVCDKYQNFTPLIHAARKFSQDTIDRYDFGIKFSSLYWWVNINKQYQYNIMHTHHRADLVGTFYVDFPENAGNLAVVRKDGSEYSSLYINSLNMLELEITPEKGRFYLFPGHLWHYVKNNEGHDDRISIAFNIYFS